MLYPVVLEPDTNGTTLVSFPDVPEAHTFGEDTEEALMQAVDALETALSLYVDDRRDTFRVLGKQLTIEIREVA